MNGKRSSKWDSSSDEEADVPSKKIKTSASASAMATGNAMVVPASGQEHELSISETPSSVQAVGASVTEPHSVSLPLTSVDDSKSGNSFAIASTQENLDDVEHEQKPSRGDKSSSSSLVPSTAGTNSRNAAASSSSNNHGYGSSSNRSYSSSSKTKPSHNPIYDGCRSVDCYERLNFIDQGTYGMVFRARCRETGEIYALKQIKFGPEMTSKVGFPITALREINILLALKHPNIVRVKEMVVGSSLDKIYMAMEYCENDLKTCMKLAKQNFSTAEIKQLMIQLLSAVAHMHRRWYIHRDLKTSNLLYSNKGYLAVCDFGMARKYGRLVAQAKACSNRYLTLPCAPFSNIVCFQCDS